MAVRLKPEAKKELLELMRHGWDSNAEVGANLCGKEDELNLGVKCFGERCEVAIRDCGAEPLVGSVHTHLYDQPYLNPHDILDSIQKWEKVACVCGNAKAPGVAKDFEKPQPFENIVCRCARIDVDKKNYDAIGKTAREYSPRIAAEIEDTKEINRHFEMKGVPVRLDEDELYMETYRELRRKVNRRLLELAKNIKYETLEVS